MAFSRQWNARRRGPAIAWLTLVLLAVALTAVFVLMSATSALLLAAACAGAALTALAMSIWPGPEGFGRHRSLLEAERRLNRALAAIQEGVWEYDLRQHVLHASPRVAEVLGLPSSVPLSLRAMLRCLDRPTRRAVIARARARLIAGEPIDEVVALPVAGGLRWVRWRARGMPADGEGGILLSGAVADITREVEDEQAIERQQAFLARVLDALPVPVAVRDRSLRFVMVNRAYCNMVRCSREMLLGQRSTDLPAGTGVPLEAMDFTVFEDSVFNTVTQWLSVGGGSRRYFRVTRGASRGADAESVVISTYEDLTQLREQEESQSKLRAFMQQVIDAMPNPMFVKDRNHRYIMTNRAHVESMGFHSTREVLGKTSRDFSPHVADEIEAIEERLFTGGIGRVDEGEFVLYDPEGKPHNILIRKSISTGPDGEPVTIGVNTDITALRQTERDLRRILNRFAMLIEGAPLGIALLDVEGVILHANPALCSMTGYALEDLQHKRHEELSPPQESEIDQARIRELFRQGYCGPFEKHYVRHDGSQISVMVTGVLVREGSRSTLVWGLVQDMTERKRAEEEIRRHRDHLRELVAEQTSDLVLAKEAAEQASEAKSTFLANMSHELRTPMHAILSFARLGQSRADWATSEKLRDYFNRIILSGERLMSLLTDLLDLSKLDAGQMTIDIRPVCLRQVAEEVTREYEAWLAAKQLRIVLEVEGDLPMALADPVRIGQVLRNLLSNAVKFSPEGRSIYLTLRPGSLPGGRRQQDRGELPAVECAVGDEGFGIPEKELEAVFEKFVQSTATRTGAGGTGLGLTICREIMEAHRGTIFARNRQEGGAEFVLRLPAHVPQDAPPEENA